MTSAIYDAAGTKIIAVLRPDDSAESYRSFLFKNMSPDQLTDLEARLAEMGFGDSDASYLKSRSQLTLAYSKSGSPYSKFVHASGIYVETEIPTDLEARLTNGWLQLSSDKSIWRSYVTIGTLASGATSRLYARLTLPTLLAAYQDLTFTLKNIGSVPLTSAILTASGSDLLSLTGGNDYAASIILGNIAVGATKTIYLRSYAIRRDLIFPAKIEVYAGSTLETSILFDSPGAGRIYCSPQTIKDFLATIDTSVVTSDEEILELISKAADAIDKGTERRFDFRTETDQRYDDPGVGKIVLRGWPILEVSSVKLYDQANTLIKTFAPTDADWLTNVTIDYDNGFIEIPIIRQPSMAATELYRWAASGGQEPSDWPRRAEMTRMTTIVATLAITYKYGCQIPPAPIRNACMKMVAAELLAKKGASDSQGVGSMTMAGLGINYPRGPYEPMPERLRADADRAIQEFRRRDQVAVSIL